jgi:transglutaminase-like putative cysteine protease
MTQDRRMTLTAAAAVVLASTVLFPVFLGSLWFYAGIGAALAVAGAGTLSRLRTLPVVVCLLISVIGLLLYLNLVFEARHSIGYVIPTPTSITGLWNLAHVGFSESRKDAPPVLDMAGLLLLSTSGIGITAVLTDLIAVRMRSAAMAGLPLLVLVTVPVTINVSRSPVAIIVIFTLGTCGYLALLSADGRERIRVWGRLISLWRTYDGDTKDAGTAPLAADASASGKGARSPYQVLRGPDTRSLAAAGRRVGFASIVLALCTPLLIPGLHAASITSADWVFGPGTGVAGSPGLYDPLTAAAQELKESRPSTVLTYMTNAPESLQVGNAQYLQQYVYTTLTDDQGWQLPFSTTTTTLPFNTQLPYQAPGVSDASSPLVETWISISGSASASGAGINLLPIPYPPVRVYASGSWEYEPSTLMLITQHGSLGGMNYQVISRDVDPKSQGQSLASVPQPPSMPADTQLPTSYRESAPLMRLALKITDKATTEYAKADAVQNWLHQGGGFQYYVYAPPIENVNDLLSFLTKTKTGDCLQSAFAMTVLMRMLGIPARMASGFTSGSETSLNHYVVKTSDAHAWPEVFFAGYGWMRFEPTPAGQGTASPPGYANQNAGGASQTLPGGLHNTAPTAHGNTKVPGHLRQLGTEIDGEGPAAVLSKPSVGTPWLAIALAVLAAIGLAFGVIAMVAPAGHRALASRPNLGPRQRVTLSAVVTVLALAGVVALALYRVLAHTKGLDLGSGWATVGIAFGAAGVAVLAAPAVCRIVVRRWRWMRAADDDASRAHAAWEELRADLADYGVGYLPSESPRALAGRITSGLALAEPAAEAVTRISLAEERATYAARPSDAETLRRDGAAVRRSIAAASGHAARWRARLFPASTMSAIADKAARIPEAWATRIRPRLLPRNSRNPHSPRLDG